MSELVNKCIICGKEAKYDLCLDCYKKKQKIASELEGSTNTLDDTKDYYNNLKYNIFKLKNMEYAKTACLKLLALGDCLQKTYGLSEYGKKAKNDAVDLLKKKEEFLNSKTKKQEISEEVPEVKTEDGNIIREEKATRDEILDYRRVYPMNFRCKDGHYVRSKSEKMIDDYLFEKRIPHIYEKKIINEELNEEYYPDFFLIINNGNEEINVILEYFGLEDDEKYVATEKKKLDFYHSNKFNIIEVREKNTGNLEDYLDMQILKIKRK
ncbi:MAG: hypothetical protein J5691_05255 [Bacilli bacterium]|nr:hypothetical protein [Bacilli bacterium]